MIEQNYLTQLSWTRKQKLILDWNFDRLYQKFHNRIYNSPNNYHAVVAWHINDILVCSKYVVCTVQKARVSDNRTKIQNLECYSNHAGSCSSSVGSVHFLFDLSMSCGTVQKSPRIGWNDQNLQNFVDEYIENKISKLSSSLQPVHQSIITYTKYKVTYFKFPFIHFISHHANQSFRFRFIVNPGFYHRIRCGSNGVKEGNKKDTEKLRKSNTVRVLLHYSPPVSYNSYYCRWFHSLLWYLLNLHLRLSVSSFPFFVSRTSQFHHGVWVWWSVPWFSFDGGSCCRNGWLRERSSWSLAERKWLWHRVFDSGSPWEW